ncbi:MAG: NADH-quinone oxidoreductase subunit NuoE [Candidatus Polarisedimenticolia bacterium]
MSDRAPGLPVSDRVDRGIDALLGRFPHKGSALLPALYLIQEEKGFVPEECMEYVAGKIGVSPAYVLGVVSFYTMFQRRPVGRHHIQLCMTLPCALRGSDQTMRHLEKRLGIGRGGTTPDGRVSLAAVECLAACDRAPFCQINDREFGPLDAAAIDRILETLK